MLLFTLLALATSFVLVQSSKRPSPSYSTCTVSFGATTSGCYSAHLVWGFDSVHTYLPDLPGSDLDIDAAADGGLMTLRSALLESVRRDKSAEDVLPLQAQSFAVFKDLGCAAVQMTMIPDSFATKMQIVIPSLTVNGLKVELYEYVDCVDGILFFSPLKLYYYLENLNAISQPPKRMPSTVNPVGTLPALSLLPEDIIILILRFVIEDLSHLRFSSIRRVSKYFYLLKPLALVCKVLSSQTLISYLQLTQVGDLQLGTLMSHKKGVFKALDDHTFNDILHTLVVSTGGLTIPQYLHLTHNPNNVDTLDTHIKSNFLETCTEYMRLRYDAKTCDCACKCQFFADHAGTLARLIRLMASKPGCGKMLRDVVIWAGLKSHFDAALAAMLQGYQFGDDADLQRLVWSAPAIFKESDI